jgi:hypothetical protein
MTLDVRVQDTQKYVADLLDRCDLGARTWDDDRSSKFIEYILLQIPTTIWVRERRENDQYVVVDGHNRLATIRDFIAGKFPLTSTSWCPELLGMTFETLPYAHRSRILSTFVHVNIINHSVPPPVVEELVRRIRS